MQYKIYQIQAMNTNISIQFVNETFTHNNLVIIEKVIEQLRSYINDMAENYSAFNKNSYVSNHSEIGSELKNFMLDETYQEIYLSCLYYQKISDGIFNPYFDGQYNPTGFVKGYIIKKSYIKFLEQLVNSNIVKAAAINAGGDIQCGVSSLSDFSFNIGIENPKLNGEIIASYQIKNGAVATSGINKRGKHIKSTADYEIIQASVVGYDVADVDVWATVLVASSIAKAKEIIKQEKLTGIIVIKDESIIIFEEGEIIC